MGRLDVAHNDRVSARQVVSQGAALRSLRYVMGVNLSFFLPGRITKLMFEQNPSFTHQDRRGNTGRSRRLCGWVLIIVLTCTGLYLCDYLLVCYRVSRNLNPFGVVKMRSYYAIPLKSGKTELVFQDPEDQVCVQSLFPHFGYTPCWYAKRKNVKRINI